MGKARIKICYYYYYPLFHIQLVVFWKHAGDIANGSEYIRLGNTYSENFLYTPQN